jgi:prepilin-type N-terminal cleavage/methylation domain-containing protein/prepilin-type processing-associated H-X9-DG protein
MRTSRRYAFTIVELLVVIAIIGMLTAVILPAVQAARRAARQAECNSNMMQASKAVLNFASSRSRMPSYLALRRIPGNSNAYYTSWVHDILPQIGREDLAKGVADILTGAGTPDPNGVLGTVTQIGQYESYIKVLNCPEDNTPDTKGAYLSYGVNGGWLDREGGAVCPRDWAANGAFSRNELAGQMSDGCDVSVTNNLGAMPDGVSNTFMLLENPRFFKWSRVAMENSGTMGPALAVFWVDLDNLNSRPAQSGYSSKALQPTFRLDNPDITGKNMGQTLAALRPDPSRPQLAVPPIEAEIDPTSGDVNWLYTLPTSYHSGGFMASFCDGRVQFIDSGMDWLVYARLMTSNGAESRPPGQAKLERNPATSRPIPYPVWQMLPINEGDLQ